MDFVSINNMLKLMLYIIVVLSNKNFFAIDDIYIPGSSESIIFIPSTALTDFAILPSMP